MLLVIFLAGAWVGWTEYRLWEVRGALKEQLKTNEYLHDIIAGKSHAA